MPLIASLRDQIIGRVWKTSKGFPGRGGHGVLENNATPFLPMGNSVKASNWTIKMENTACVGASIIFIFQRFWRADVDFLRNRHHTPKTYLPSSKPFIPLRKKKQLYSAFRMKQGHANETGAKRTKMILAGSRRCRCARCRCGPRPR